MTIEPSYISFVLLPYKVVFALETNAKNGKCHNMGKTN